MNGQGEWEAWQDRAVAAETALAEANREAEKAWGFERKMMERATEAEEKLEAAERRANDLAAELEALRESRARDIVTHAGRVQEDADALQAALELSTWQTSVAEGERDALADALRDALDCKGSYNGTVSEKGGDPAICTKCEAIARAALDRHTHQDAPTFICVICNEDLTAQVERKAGSSKDMPPSVVAICRRGHYTEFKTDALRHTHQDKAVT